MTSTNNNILSAQDIVVEFVVRDRVLTAVFVAYRLSCEEGVKFLPQLRVGFRKISLDKTFTGMLEDNGRIAQGSIKYRNQELTI